jgi:RES domain-containing protein
MPALYMSEDLLTAVAEYEQGLGIRPGTFCAYDVDVEDIADLLEASVCRDLAISGDALLCPWKEIAFVHRQRPPTWDIGDRLRASGAKGARVPSAARPDGVNLVLWQWNGPGARVLALDPDRDLPRDGRSWEDLR